MEFNRHIYKGLTLWKNKTRRKPLILRGARQVGKTTIINNFGKEYSNYIYLNLEKRNDKNVFLEFENPREILEFLMLRKGITDFQPNNTLLFIDEIQESEEAISILRYFFEDLPELYVIAAGSLLEQTIKHVTSFPVGRIEYLYPMNFQEFLEAKGKADLLKILNEIPLNKIAHKLLIEQFHEYKTVAWSCLILNYFVFYQYGNKSAIDLRG